MTFPTVLALLAVTLGACSPGFNAREGLVTFPTSGDGLGGLRAAGSGGDRFNAREGLVTFPTHSFFSAFTPGAFSKASFNAREGLVTFPTKNSFSCRARSGARFNAREGLVTFPTEWAKALDP